MALPVIMATTIMWSAFLIGIITKGLGQTHNTITLLAPNIRFIHIDCNITEDKHAVKENMGGDKQWEAG